MKNWVSLKLIYFRRKTQALSELAIFGTILLLVFAFMIRMGMIYMHTQDINMRAFRLAMSQAIKVNRPDASATVLLVEDKHIPDPGDIVGIGDFIPAQGFGNVVWGNTLPYYTPIGKTYPYETAADLNKMHFQVNDIIKEYQTEGYGKTVVTGNSALACVDCSSAAFYAYTDHYGWSLINQNETRVVDPVEDPRAIYMDASKITDVITKIRIDGTHDVLSVLYVQPKPAPNEYQVACFFLLNPANGELNLNYLALNADLDEDGIPDVNPSNVQGIIPGITNMTRRDSIKLTEESEGNGNSRTSVTKQKFLNSKIEHKVKTNQGVDAKDFDYNVIMNRTTTWKTPK